MTTTTETTRCFYVTYSPRGFSNELSVAVFTAKSEADDFRSSIDNNPNAYTVPTSSPTHRRIVSLFKKETAEYYRMSPLARYQYEANDTQRGGW